MDSLTQISKVAFSLFILMNPIGNIPIFIAVLKNTSAKRQRVIIFRELIIALGIFILFAFLGDFLLSALGVSQSSVMISGGIILFLIALKMIFPSKSDQEIDQNEQKEPLLVPLAIPLVAGPAVLAAVTIYAKEESNLITLPAIGIAWAAAAAILLSSFYIRRILGERGILACERLMGFILTLISVRLFLEGTKIYIHSCGL